MRAGPPFILNCLSLTKRTCGAWGRKPASPQALDCKLIEPAGVQLFFLPG